MAIRLNANVDYTWLVEFFPWDPALSAEKPVCLADRPVFFDANDPDAPNRVYRGWVAQALSLTRSLFGHSALIGGNGLGSYGAVTLTVGDEFRAKRAYFKTLNWAGHRVRVLRGIAGAAYATYQSILDGVITTDPGFEQTRVAIQVSDLSYLLQRLFRLTKYAGTGGFEGGDDLKDQYKLDAVGVVRGREGVIVDQANGWVDYCASGFQAVLKVTDGANVLTEDVTNPPAGGKYYKDMANGRLRFTTPATYSHRVDFVSKFASGSTQLGTILKAIALGPAGYTSDQVDSDAFDDLDADRPEAVGWPVNPGDTCQSLFDNLLKGPLGFYTGTPTGRLTVGLVKPPVSTSRSDPTVAVLITDRDIVPDSLKIAPSPAPPSGVNLKLRQNLTVLDTARIAPAAADDDKAFALEQWRTITKLNPDTLEAYPEAKPIDIESAFDDLAEGDPIAQDLADLVTVPRPTGEVTIDHPPFGLLLGSEMWIASDMDEVDAPSIVAEITESSDDRQVKAKLWSLKVAA